MEKLKTLTVRYLRDLARKSLGMFKAIEVPPMSPKRPPTPPLSTRDGVVKDRPVEASPPTPEPQKNQKRQPAPAAAVQREAEPVVEGFFVARVAGELEARRHHLTEERASQPPPQPRSDVYDEHLGELPESYQDDTAVLMPRDPNTLFVLWDFRSDTRARAAEGLEAPRAVLRVFDDANQVVREVDFALESKSFYVHNLSPGHAYRVEAHFVGRDGKSKRVGRSTNMAALPSAGPSSDTSVRFIRIPWEMSLLKLRQMIRDGRAQIERLAGDHDYLRVARYALPNSASMLRQQGEQGLEEHGWQPSPSGRPS